MASAYEQKSAVRTAGISTSTATMTRPNDTTAYSAGDVVGTSPATVLEFSNLGIPNSKLTINEVILRIDASAIPSGMAGFRLHLYNTAPTVIADNAAFNLPSVDRAKYLGYIAIATPVDIGDTLVSQELYVGKEVDLVTSSLYGILETAGAFTPTAQCIKTITLR